VVLGEDEDGELSQNSPSFPEDDVSINDLYVDFILFFINFLKISFFALCQSLSEERNVLIIICNAIILCITHIYKFFVNFRI